MRRLDITAEEAARIEELSVKGLVAVIVKLPDVEGEPQESQRHLLTMESLATLATRASIDTVLEEARSAVAYTPPRSGSNPNAGPKVDYSAPENAGRPHKGRATDAESEYVRSNLEAVNARLMAAGERTIDPNDPIFAKRYGFGGEATTEGTPGVEGAEPAEQPDDQAEVAPEQPDAEGEQTPAETEPDAEPAEVTPLGGRRRRR